MNAEPADTPDIVERLTRALSATRCGLCVAPNISDADIREAADTILALRATDGKLRAALWDADGWFRDYERQHLAKNTDDGDKKAATNLHRANRCRDALIPSPQARDEGGAVEGWVMVPREPTDQMLDACTAAPAPLVPHPDQGWLPIVLCPTDGVWHLVKLPDGAEVVASFEGRELGPHVRQWRVKEFGYHNPARPIGEVGGVKQMSAPYDTFVIKSLPEGVYPTHFRPNDTVYGASSPPPDAINTTEGEVHQAREDAYARWAEGVGRHVPKAATFSPPQAPQEVAGLVAEWNTARAVLLDRAVTPDRAAAIISAGDRLAAALTPRELTDEEAERGARAYCEALRQEAVMIVGEPDEYQPFAAGYDGLDATQRGYLLAAIRAAYRAITEEPARTAQPHTPDRP